MHLFILIFLYFDCIVKSRSEKALILNIDTTKLDDTIHHSEYTKCPILTACPASSPLEKQFNDEVSISKNSLFLRNVYRGDTYQKDIPVNICDDAFRPAVLLDVISKEMQIGYELYYEARKISLKDVKYDWYKSMSPNEVNTESETTTGTPQPKPSNTENKTITSTQQTIPTNAGNETTNFSQQTTKAGNEMTNFTQQTKVGNEMTNLTQQIMPTNAGNETTNLTQQTIINTGNETTKSIQQSTIPYTRYETTYSTQKPKLVVAKHQDRIGNQTRFSFPNGSSTAVLVFHWIPVVTIKFVSDHQKCVHLLDVGIVKINSRLSDTCADYQPADDISTSLYSEENQKKILKNIRAPLSYSNTIFINGDSCGNPYGCLKKTQIIPLWYFRTRSAKLASCSYANSVPIWKNIAEKQVAKVDRYVYSVIRYITKDLKGEGRLYFGVYGVLKLNKSQDTNESQEIYLSAPRHNLAVPVPKIIYRIVYCAVCVWKKTLIVIHNDPNPIPASERICSNSSEVPSWAEIRNTDYRTGLTYACRLTREINDILGAQFIKDYNFRGFDELNLDEFDHEWVDQPNEPNVMVMDYPARAVQRQNIRYRIGREFDALCRGT